MHRGGGHTEEHARTELDSLWKQSLGPEEQAVVRKWPPGSWSGLSSYPAPTGGSFIREMSVVMSWLWSVSWKDWGTLQCECPWGCWYLDMKLWQQISYEKLGESSPRRPVNGSACLGSAGLVERQKGLLVKGTWIRVLAILQTTNFSTHCSGLRIMTFFWGWLSSLIPFWSQVW